MAKFSKSKSVRTSPASLTLAETAAAAAAAAAAKLKTEADAALAKAIADAKAKAEADAAAAALAKALADAKLAADATASAKASSSPVVGGKTEGTSQTVGQHIVVSSTPVISSAIPLVSVSAGPTVTAATTVNISIPAKTGQSVTQASFVSDAARNGSVSGPVVTDVSKVGIFFAAAGASATTLAIPLAPGTLADALAGNAGVVDLAPAGAADILSSDVVETTTETVIETSPIVETTVTVLDSETLPKEQVIKVLTEAQKIDLTITMKSKESDPLEFNAIQIPQQEAVFVYQQWAEDELDLVSQEDPAKDPLLTQTLRSVPRYVELRWESLNVIEQTTENEVSRNAETERTKEFAFRNARGIGNLANSVTPKPIGNSSKNLNMSNNGTTEGKIIDIHEIEKGFDSVSNRHEFVNSVPTIIKVPQALLGLFEELK